MKLATIRAYATNALYFRVNVWSSKEAMRKHCFWVRLEREAVGVCSSEEIWRKRRKIACMGEINLVKRHIGTEVIVHELAHAAHGYARRCGLDFSKDERHKLSLDSAEERFCYAIGRMAMETVNKLYRLKLLK